MRARSAGANRPRAAAAGIPGVSIRAAGATDALCISVLGTQVFLDTYAADGIRPSLAREVTAHLSAPAVATLLAMPAVRFLVAERAGHLIGFAQLTEGATQDRVAARPAAELNRLYVLERFTGAGVGAALLARAEALAAAAGAAALWLTAWDGNRRAIGFYARRGYTDVGATPYVFEDERYVNRVFVKALAGGNAARRAADR